MKMGTRSLLFDERGFSTIGMALAMIITLALIFTAAQVQQLSSASAEIQEVADSAALAAENEVAQFYLLAQICDAVLLSQTLAVMLTYGAGLVFLCVPFMQGLGQDLLAIGESLLSARSDFYKAATQSLNTLQDALPFLAMGKASLVIAANANPHLGTSYAGLGILLPLQGQDIVASDLQGSEALAQEIRQSGDSIADEARKVEELAAEANEAKERAFMADCGANPEYCMYQRASTLAGMTGSENPLYSTVDTWSFSVALQRARAYYAKRYEQEAPASDDVMEQARSVLRKNFYAFAVDQMQEGYVHEDEARGFSANFPLMPKNTEEMKGTVLYSQEVYPLSELNGKTVMHAYDGCPGIGTIAGRGSLAARDRQNMPECPYCHLTSASMGKVASASTAIENGFEYHYNIVAEAAKEYQEKQGDYQQEASGVKQTVSDLTASLQSLVAQGASQRISVSPPGRVGALALVFSTAEVSSEGGYSNGFVKSSGTLGTRLAISAATLAPDSSEGSKTVITSLLDGLRDRVPWLSSTQGSTLLQIWSAALGSYGSGQEALVEGVRQVCSKSKLLSASGLGPWAADKLQSAIEALGLQAADLSAVRPVVVNSYHVLAADGSAFSSQVLSARSWALSYGEGTLLSTALSYLTYQGVSQLASLAGDFAVATIGFTGSPSGDQVLSVVLPSFIRGMSADAANSLVARLGSLFPTLSGVRQWE